MQRIFGLCLLVMLMSTVSLAQGSGSSSTKSSRPFAVTKTVIGKITEIKSADKILLVEDRKGNKTAVRIDARTKFSAAPKSELSKKKNLMLDDFETGQMVKIIYRQSDRIATMVQLQPASS